MQTHIQKWGNSFGIRIPVNWCHDLHLHSGSVVELALEDKYLIVKPQKYSLEEMLKKITPQNKHSLLMEDSVKGCEVW